MKRLFPKEYRGKMIAAIGVCVVAIILYMISQHLDAIIGFVRALFRTLRPVLIGVGIAYILSPILRYTENGLAKLVCRKRPRPRLCRALGASICFILFLAVAVAFLWIVLPQVYRSVFSMARRLVNFVNVNSGQINELLHRVGVIDISGRDVTIAWEELMNRGMDYAAAVFKNALILTKGVYRVIFDLLVALAVSAYSLFEKERFAAQVKKMIYAVFAPDTCAALIYWMTRANRIFSGFISGKIYDSLIIGVLCYVAMCIFGMEYPELISCIVGITNVLPFFGPIVGGVTGTLILLIVNPVTAFWFAILVIALQSLDGYFLGPHILGETLGLSAFWILLSIMICGGLFGFTGMILGVPAFAIIYALAKTFVDSRLKMRGLPLDAREYRNAPASIMKEHENDRGNNP